MCPAPGDPGEARATADGRPRTTDHGGVRLDRGTSPLALPGGAPAGRLPHLRTRATPLRRRHAGAADRPDLDHLLGAPSAGAPWPAARTRSTRECRPGRQSALRGMGLTMARAPSARSIGLAWA